jgi:hypothetical protein
VNHHGNHLHNLPGATPAVLPPFNKPGTLYPDTYVLIWRPAGPLP